MTPAAVLSILVKTTGSQAAMAQMARLDATSKAAAKSTDGLAAAQRRGQSAFQTASRLAQKAAADVTKLEFAQKKAALAVEKAKLVESEAIKKSGAESVRARQAALNLQAAETRLAETSTQLAGAQRRSAEATAAMASSQAGASSRMAGVNEKLHAVHRAAGYVALGVGLIGAASVKTAATYEQSMNKLQSVAHLTGQQMKAVSDLAVKLGADINLPGTSAQDAAEAMTEMIKAGVSMKDTMAGVRDVLVLSAAAQISNADAAEIASNALNTFKLRGQDVKFVTDELANTANASSVEITDVADSLKMAGAVFSSFQAPVLGAKGAMHELNVAIGLLGNAGIKGSDAGTSLKQSLLQLSGPSDRAKGAMRALYIASQNSSSSESRLATALRGTGKERSAAIKGLEAQAGATLKGGDIAYTATGKMRSFHDIIRLVAQGTRKMTQEQKQAYITQIFGADAVRTVLALIKAGPKEWDKMSKAVSRQGAAQDLAKAQMKGFKGAVESLKSTFQTLAIQLGTPLLQPLAKVLRGFASFLSSIDPAALGIAIGMIGGIAGGLWLVVKAQAAWNALAAANPVGLIIVGLVALGAALVIAYKKSETFRNAVNAGFAALKTAATSAIAFIQQVPAMFGQVTSAITTEVGKWKVVAFALKAMGAYFAPAFEVIKGVVRVNLALISAWFRTTFGVLRAIVGGAFTALKGIVSGGLQAMHGVIQVIGGIFKGDFRQIWAGIKNIFGGALKAILGLLKGQVQTLAGAGKAIGKGIMDGITGALSAGWGAVKGFVQKIVDVVNSVLGFFHLPKIPDVAGGGSSSSPSRRNPAGDRAGGNTNELARGGAFARTGGFVSRPITLMGEEAPMHPEFVIPTNPAYRGRARALLAQAAGTIGFAGGGVNPLDVANTVTDVGRVLTNPVGSLSQAIVGAGATAGDFIRNLPKSSSLPSWIRGMGGQLTNKAKDWIKKKFADEALPDLGGGGGPAGTMDGHRVAGWILSILKRARADGVSFRVNDGYRDLAGQWAAFRNHGGMAGVRAGVVAYPGRSNHGGLKYPAGAVDISPGWENLVAWLAKHPNSPLHHYGNPADPYHFSAKGNAKGGMFGKGPLARSSKKTPNARTASKIDISQFNHKFPAHTLSDLNGKARFNYDIVKRIAQSVGLPGDLFAQIALGESGFYPGIWGTDPGGTHGYGLWAITADAWGGDQTLLRKYNSLGGSSGMLNPFKNAEMTKFLYDHSPVKTPGQRGFPWYGTRYVGSGNQGPPSANLGRVSRSASGNSGGSSSSKKDRKITKTGGKPKRMTMSAKQKKLLANTEEWAKIWAPIDSWNTHLQNQFALNELTPGVKDDLFTAAQGIRYADFMINKAATFAQQGVPGAFEWLANAKTARSDWVQKYGDVRDANKGSEALLPQIWRGPAEAAYAASKADSTGGSEDNAWKDAIKQLAADVRTQTLRGQAIERMQPQDLVIAWMQELSNGRTGTSAALAAQGPSTPGIVAGGYR